MASPTTDPDKPRTLPINRMIVIFGAVGVLSLVAMGARQLIGGLAIKTIPIVGEWRAAGKPWRIIFRPDKTVASFDGPSQPEASDASAAAGGAYSIDYFGTLWLKLNDGRAFTATLSAETPNRIDLVEFEQRSRDGLAAGAAEPRPAGFAAESAKLERVPIGWKHPIDKNSLQINKLEHVLMRHRIYPMSKCRKCRSTFSEHALIAFAAGSANKLRLGRSTLGEINPFHAA